MPPRDNQRHKVYMSETIALRHEPKMSLDEIEAMVRRIESTTLWSTLTDGRTWPVQVKDGRGRRRAGGSGKFITLPRWSRTPSIVLHELAHTAARRRWGTPNIAPHGPEWTGTAIELWRAFHPDRLFAVRFEDALEARGGWAKKITADWTLSARERGETI